MSKFRWVKSKYISNYNSSIPIIDAEGKQAYLTLQYLDEEIVENTDSTSLEPIINYVYKDVPIEELY